MGSLSLFCFLFRASLFFISALNFLFLVVLTFLGFFVITNLTYRGVLIFSSTTPSNLSFLFFGGGFFGVFCAFLLSLIEITGKMVRPVSLTCRLCANISAGHMLSAMFFGGSLPFLGQIILIFYYTFEAGIALIQRFVFSFLLGDYSVYAK